MKNILLDIIVIAALLGIGLTGGYRLGKNTVKMEEKTVVEYRALPAVHVHFHPQPFEVSIPTAPQFIYFTDTVTSVQVVDTAAILADWALNREYAGRIIEDSTGTVDYSATVQYNRLQDVSIDYAPVQRTVVTATTITRQPRWAITAGIGAGWTPKGIQPHIGLTIGYVMWSK